MFECRQVLNDFPLGSKIIRTRPIHVFCAFPDNFSHCILMCVYFISGCLCGKLDYFTSKGRGIGTVVKAACLESRRSSPTLAFKFQRNKMFLPCSLVRLQYCGEPLWPRGRLLGLRPQGLEFSILCLKDSDISFISSSSGGSPGLL